MNKGTLAYLATPYCRFSRGPSEAFREAALVASLLLRSGVNVYSPIAHTHPLAVYGNMNPFHHSIWLPFDDVMMSRCDVLIVAHMDGWQESVGIAHEVKFFESAGKPIFDLPDITIANMVRRKRQDAPDPHRIESARKRLNELDAEIAAAIQWGAALAAMEGERKSLRRFLGFYDPQERIANAESL